MGKYLAVKASVFDGFRKKMIWMEIMLIVYSIGTIIGIGILLWFRTKSGKKWLENQ